MKQPYLVILAAGMGSRFGGLKQITPVDAGGHAIIDFSLFDAYRAGFRKVVFIIKKAIEDDFKNFIGKRVEKYFEVSYVFQELGVLPEGYSVPEGREKPWGTGHAVLCCKDVIDGPFAVINSDDFYGPSAFTALYDFLSKDRDDKEHAIVAYRLKNTMTENGSVARGVCSVENGCLTGVEETLNIFKNGDDGISRCNGEERFISGDTPVSMNCWGFGPQLIDELASRFPAWLDENLPVNPLKCEYFLPYAANCIIQEGIGTIEVLNCDEKWHGITYREDMDDICSAIAKKRELGIYPETLLD